MDRQRLIEELIEDFGFSNEDIYLLDLIPLIETIWADNQNQEPELRILYQFTIEHIAEINSLADGEEIITDEHANSFLDRFAHNRPDPELLKRLREIALSIHANHSNEEYRKAKQNTIVDYCMDIAAACVTSYPYSPNERIMADEKKVIQAILKAYNISPDQPIE